MARPWNELPTSRKAAAVLTGAVELVLTAVAVRDLARRPADQVRGSKGLWSVLVLVQPVGPPAYLLWGRHA